MNKFKMASIILLLVCIIGLTFVSDAVAFYQNFQLIFAVFYLVMLISLFLEKRYVKLLLGLLFLGLSILFISMYSNEMEIYIIEYYKFLFIGFGEPQVPPSVFSYHIKYVLLYASLFIISMVGFVKTINPHYKKEDMNSINII
ncbi:MAG: hypothetical protein ABH890_00965 [Bacillota bacterium]